MELERSKGGGKWRQDVRGERGGIKVEKAGESPVPYSSLRFKPSMLVPSRGKMRPLLIQKVWSYSYRRSIEKIAGKRRERTMTANDTVLSCGLEIFLPG